MKSAGEQTEKWSKNIWFQSYAEFKTLLSSQYRPGWNEIAHKYKCLSVTGEFEFIKDIEYKQAQFFKIFSTYEPH